MLHYGNTYMDRVAIAAAAPMIREEFVLDEVTLGVVFSAFTLAYGLFQVPGGWLADRFGPRRILAGIVSYWSVFTMATAAAWNAVSLIVIRFLFGAGEAGAFPAATRAFSRWLPSTERGFAQGITHSGARLAGAVTPPLVAWMMVRWGWRWPFLLFGATGFVWGAIWFSYYRDRPEDHPGVNAAELRAIRAGRESAGDPGDAGDPETDRGADGVDGTGGAGEETRVPWGILLRSRNMWLICAMYAAYVYTFWIFLTWIPTYLVESRGFSLLESGVYAGLPLFAGAVTNTLGGWASDRLSVRRGLRWGRRIPAVAGFVAGVAFIVPGALAGEPLVAVACLTLAAAGLEFTTGVSWAVVIDVGQEYAGTVSAMMNMSGNLAGALSPLVFGALVQWTGRWEVPFLIAAALSLVAALLWLRIDPERSVLTGAPLPSGRSSGGPGSGSRAS
ncbi:MAG: MFS transporter [Gemmatimonadetes bacterium]|nr:MFS transporter [Gemmatimonadota bacterium]NIR78369.1 MFS transporter [Gemmatimonadota bacterium]NIT86962.1 MFS transporter [Gemmatimonadota bacterium]NIU30809.1 MFS transporter [Gemmatimonadota bacterium]NIU35589.1 MFS transporter [Gemmatimonadota bacterium]